MVSRRSAAGTTAGASGSCPRRRAAAELLATGTELIVEERVPLRRELAALVARSPFGQVAAYPVVETVQRDGICVEVLAPAPGLPEGVASRPSSSPSTSPPSSAWSACSRSSCSRRPTASVVNELAMRPHNSGHWTIEGARTSQFEQHLRAVLDYPLGDTSLTAPAVVMANVLGGEPGGTRIDERLHHLFAADPAARVHLYGKQVRPGRKIGHVTVLGEDLAAVRARGPRRPPDGCQEGDADGTGSVGVIMGSDSDWPTMQAAAEALAEFDVAHEVRVVSAHRTPQAMLDYADAGGRPRAPGHHRRGRAARPHLPGMVAA